MKKNFLLSFLLTLSLSLFLTELQAQTRLLQTSGKLSFLRVNQVGGKYGPPSDQIDGEVIIKFVGQNNNAYGFKLRKDSNQLTHQGMLGILRDAFNYGHRVTIDFYLDAGDRNGEITRVWLTRSNNLQIAPNVLINAGEKVRQNRN